MGRLFFDILQPQCVQGRTCEPHEAADVCLERQKADGVARTGLKFFEQPLRYERPRAVSERPSSVADEDDAQDAGEHGAQSERDEGDAEEVVRVAGVGSPSGAANPPSSSEGGLSGFFRRIFGSLG